MVEFKKTSLGNALKDGTVDSNLNGKLLIHHLNKTLDDVVEKSTRSLLANGARQGSSTEGRRPILGSFRSVVIVDEMGVQLLLYRALLLKTEPDRYHSQKLLLRLVSGVSMKTECVHNTECTLENPYSSPGDIFQCALRLVSPKDLSLEPDQRGNGLFSAQNFSILLAIRVKKCGL